MCVDAAKQFSCLYESALGLVIFPLAAQQSQPNWLNRMLHCLQHMQSLHKHNTMGCVAFGWLF